jgi:hypothetical protein
VIFEAVRHHGVGGGLVWVVPCGESEGGGSIHCSSMGGAWQDDGEATGGRQHAEMVEAAGGR